jgi:hypothetical protein
VATGTTYYYSIQPESEAATSCYIYYSATDTTGDFYKGNTTGSYDLTGDIVSPSGSRHIIKLCD